MSDHDLPDHQTPEVVTEAVDSTKLESTANVEGVRDNACVVFLMPDSVDKCVNLAYYFAGYSEEGKRRCDTPDFTKVKVMFERAFEMGCDTAQGYRSLAVSCRDALLGETDEDDWVSVFEVKCHKTAFELEPDSAESNFDMAHASRNNAAKIRYFVKAIELGDVDAAFSLVREMIVSRGLTLSEIKALCDKIDDDWLTNTLYEVVEDLEDQFFRTNGHYRYEREGPPCLGKMAVVAYKKLSVLVAQSDLTEAKRLRERGLEHSRAMEIFNRSTTID